MPRAGATVVLLSMLAACASTPPAVDACANADELRAPLTESLVAEINDHRYEDCGPGTTCNAHVAGLAVQMNLIDAGIRASCPTFKRWREGMPGQVDPRDVSNGTLDQYADDDARKALHELLVADALTAAEPQPDAKNVVMTMGAPGSGKSYVLKHLGLCQDAVVLIDPDEFKQRLVEYQAAIAADDILAADRVHRESSVLAKRTRDEAIAAGQPLCIDGVMSKKAQAIELITRLQDNGYHVTIVAVSVPFDVAYERVLSRGDETGRFVPYEFAKTAHSNIEEHRDELLNLAHVGYLFDTNQPYGEPPLLIKQY